MIAMKNLMRYEVLPPLLLFLKKKKKRVQFITPICKHFSGFYEYEVWPLIQLLYYLRASP